MTVKPSGHISYFNNLKQPSELQQTLWQRLDIFGHDACRIRKTGTIWLIEGTAIFGNSNASSNLNYHLTFNEDWSSRSNRISGWSSTNEIKLLIERDANSQWKLNGEIIASLQGSLDLDLGFTPATNTNAIRRLHLDIGERRETVAAWLDASDWRLKPLKQSYERLTNNLYEYRSMNNNFCARLTTNGFGVVTEYPSLWTTS